MRLAAAAALLCACQGPDRWHTSVSRGDGAIDGYSDKLDFDTEETRLEVGISGPLGFKKPEPIPVIVEQPYPAPAPAPADDSGLPLMELLYVALGAGAWKGQEVARAKYRQRRSA